MTGLKEAPVLELFTEKHRQLRKSMEFSRKIFMWFLYNLHLGNRPCLHTPLSRTAPQRRSVFRFRVMFAESRKSRIRCNDVVTMVHRQLAVHGGTALVGGLLGFGVDHSSRKSIDSLHAQRPGAPLKLFYGENLAPSFEGRGRWRMDEQLLSSGQQQQGRPPVQVQSLAHERRLTCCMKTEYY